MSAVMPELAQDEILTSREAAEFLKISVLTLHKALKSQDLPSHKLGRKYVFLRSEILEWLKRQ